MKNKQYFINTYADFWKKQVRKYGIGTYEKKIIEILQSRKAETAFEVGIGTGWPIAAALYNNGVEISGCDPAPKLIMEARGNYPNMKLYSGELKRSTEQYDLVYCIRVSWYINNFLETIIEMLNMCKKGGYVVFDIQNRRSLYHLYMCYHMFMDRIKCLFTCKEQNYGLAFYNLNEIVAVLEEYRMREKSIRYRYYYEYRFAESSLHKWKQGKVLFIIKVL